MLVWQRPLAVIYYDGVELVTFDVGNLFHDLPGDAIVPEDALSIIDEHIQAYFESFLDMLDEAESDISAYKNIITDQICDCVAMCNSKLDKAGLDAEFIK